MTDPTLKLGLARWAVKHLGSAFRQFTADDVEDVWIEQDAGYAYSSVTFEDASVKIVVVLAGGDRRERDLDKDFKLGDFVAEVVELSKETA